MISKHEKVKLLLIVKISFQLVKLLRWKIKSILSYKRHVTRCILRLQLAMVSNISATIAKSRTELYI